MVSEFSSGGKPNDGICSFGVCSFCWNRTAERVKSSYYQNPQLSIVSCSKVAESDNLPAEYYAAAFRNAAR